MAQFPNREAEISFAAAAEQATTTKDEALEGLTRAMKAKFRYAENTVNFDDDKLKVLGWGGRKAGTSSRPWSIAGTKGANRVRRISEATEATEATEAARETRLPWKHRPKRFHANVLQNGSFRRLPLRRSVMNKCPGILPAVAK